jgi:glycosyltransferase involved in cell wall biosynthesis
MGDINKNIKLFLEFIPSDKVKYFYYASDLVVLPYKEFMSQSALGADALAFEKPSIVTDVGGLSELMKDKDFVVEQNNPRMLAEKILLALGDDELLKKLSADSRDLAEEYSWDKVGEKTMRLYRCVLSDQI